MISLLVFVMLWVPRLLLWGVPLLILLRFVWRRWRRKGRRVNVVAGIVVSQVNILAPAV